MSTQRRARALGITALLVVGLSAGPSAFGGELPEWATKVNQSWYDAFNAGDATAVASLYAADAILFLPGETLHGRPAIKAFQEANFEKTSYSCKWEIDGVQALAKHAAVWGHDSCSETPKAGGAARTVKSRWLAFYERQEDGSWLITRDGGEEVQP